MSNQSKDRKISQFLTQTSLPSDAKLSYISGNTNYKISLADFQSSLGVSGTIVQDGDPLGTPILNTSGSINNIRNLEDGPGIKTSVSVQNGVTIETDFSQDSTGAQVIKDLAADQLVFRSFVAGSGINIAQSNGTIQVALSATPASNKTVIINDINDFPAAVSGVITLADDTEYSILNDITTANRFVLGNNTVISGSDYATIALTYSGTGVMFTSASKTWTLKDLTISCLSGTFMVFTGTGVEILQVANCRIYTDILGTISDFYGIHFDDTQQIVTTNGFTFSGTNGVILLEANLSVIAAGTLYSLGSATFNAFSVTDAFVTLNGSSVFLSGLASSANITTGNIGSIHNSRFFGTGTPLSTIAVGDKRWSFHINNGIKESSIDVLMSQVSNATVTTIALVNTPVKVSGIWTEEDAFVFTTDATGRMTYIGERDAEVDVSMSFTIGPVSGTNKKLALYAAKNGSVITNSGAVAVISSATNSQRVTVIWRVSLTTNDYIESYVENRTDAVDILITDAVMRLSA